VTKKRVLITFCLSVGEHWVQPQYHWTFRKYVNTTIISLDRWRVRQCNHNVARPLDSTSTAQYYWLLGRITALAVADEISQNKLQWFLSYIRITYQWHWLYTIKFVMGENKRWIGNLVEESGLSYLQLFSISVSSIMMKTRNNHSKEPFFVSRSQSGATKFLDSATTGLKCDTSRFSFTLSLQQRFLVTTIMKLAVSYSTKNLLDARATISF